MENLTAEQAEKLFEDSYKAIKGNETPPAAAEPVEPEVPAEPAPAEPAVETPTEPVKEKEAAPAPAEPTKPEDKPTDDPYAWLKDVPEELRQKVMEQINTKLQLEHRVRSDDGRVKAHQEKVLKLQRQIAELQQRPTATKQPAPAERQVTPEAWQQIVKSDPELAAAFEARVKQEVDSAVGSIRNELQEFKRTAVEPLYEHSSQQYVEEQKHTLRQMVPNYEQVVASPEYSDWLTNYASEGIRRLALTSTDANDAVNVLRFYANDMIAMGKAPPPQQHAPVQAATPVNDAADKIAAARTEKLAAVPPANKPVAIAPTGNNAKRDFTKDEAEALFVEEWKKLNKRT